MPIDLRLLLRLGKDVRNRIIADPAPRFIDDPAKIVNRQIGGATGAPGPLRRASGGILILAIVHSRGVKRLAL